MFDQKLYREACRELSAPEHKIEEIIAMTNNTDKKKMRPLRTALIAAAAVVIVMNAASFFLSVRFYRKRQNGVYN